MDGPASWYRVLWEQPFIDLWSVPHTLTGTIIAYAARRYRVNVWLAFSACLTFAVLWEVMESVTGISAPEFWTNHLSDIILAQVGFAAGWLVFERLDEAKERRVFYWVAGIFVVFIAAGLISGKLIGPK